jgi:hypothetical protein
MRSCDMLLALLISAAQWPCPRLHAQVETLAPGLRKLSGVEPASKTTYARIFLDGIFVPPNSPSDAASLPATSPPVLIAECTQPPSGKPHFELHAHYENLEDTAYHPPWHPTPGDLYPPETQKVTITMDFFGYTRVKPAKRQWEYVTAPVGELRYDPPSSRSRNLEEINFYLQYLRALPILRLTLADKAAQFNINPLFDAIRKEPLCRASGI